MKKDKKWFIDKWTKERDKTSIHEPMYYFINDFITDVKELDEPEITLNRAFDKVSEIYPITKEEVCRHLEKVTAYGGKVTYGEPEVLSHELPVIPKYVAEWITKHRDTFDLYPMLKRLEKNSSKLELTYKWYRTNTHEFVNAYLTGEYEVEEEPLYYALFKGHELTLDSYKNLGLYRGTRSPMYISYKHPLNDEFVIKMSKSQWNELGINNSNANFVKVGDVEE